VNQTALLSQTTLSKGTIMIIKPSLKQQLRMLIAAALSSICAVTFAVEEGEPAPDFKLPSIYADKPEISLQGLSGKTVFVDFWASWCAPCLRSLPLYNAMYHKYQDQGLEVVAISVDNPVEDGLDFLLDTPLDFLIPSDPEGDAAELFEVIGMPTSYLIDPNGNVRLVHMGFRDGDMEIIEEELKKVLAGN
jgi:thiol-disulfide isomerase/thioredoxin